MFQIMLENTISVSTILQACQKVTNCGLWVKHRCNASNEYSINYGSQNKLKTLRKL